MKEIKIGSRIISNKSPPYIVAEISANHNGDIDSALRLVEVAKDSGADAVKIQTYTPDTMTIECNLPDFQITDGTWKGVSLYELYKEAHTPWEWHEALFNKAREVGIDIFSTPFDETSVDFLDQFSPVAYKIASFEITDHLLIKKIASKGKPLIISTGMANLEEIEESLNIIREQGNDKIILLHCISGYPAPIDEMNLRNIEYFKNHFDVIPGLSDHSLGITASLVSVGLGACFIEKHFTESREKGGPDSTFSLEPDELRHLCSSLRDGWMALGQTGFERASIEQENRKFRRSIYFIKDLQQGDTITDQDIKRIRPGYGVPPKYFNDIIGKKVKCNIKRGTPVNFDLLEGNL